MADLTFLYIGCIILKETWGENTLIPLYDNEESVCGIIYNGIPYYFLKNLQGDVIAIVNSNAEVVGRYSYDAWGVCTYDSSTTDAVTLINPYRYRSYYYDTEIANVSYSYDTFNNLSEIVRGDGLKYVLNYNAFHNLESIGIDGKAQLFNIF